MPKDIQDWSRASASSEAALSGSPFAVARDGANHDLGNFNLDAAAHWLLFATDIASRYVTVQVKGSTTSTIYPTRGVAPNGGLTFCKVYPGLDPVVDITVALKIGSGTGSAFIAQLFSEVIDPGADLDWSAFNTVADSGTPLAGSGTSSGAQAVLDYCLVTMVCNTARVFHARVWDGASGSTKIGEAVIGNASAAAFGEQQQVTLQRLKSSIGNPLTVDLDFGLATGEKASIVISGRFR